MGLSVHAGAEQPRGVDPGTGPLFQSTDTLELVLRLPWRKIVTDEFFYQGAYPSVLEVVDAKGITVSFPVGVERRGWSRQVICRYPPLKLRFSKEETKDTLFEGQKSLKLVIPCDDGEKYQQYLVLEALAYRMYNLVSDFSFRVRPVAISFIDTETDKAGRQRFAFLVEDDGDVAERNGQKKLKLGAVSPEQLDPLEASKLALFQYMIANTAWALKRDADEEQCCDNLKLIGQAPEKGSIYAIPNDFDSSGLVDAYYARSKDDSKSRREAGRQFKGSCVHNSTLDDARKSFLDRENEIRSLVQDDDHLVEHQKTQALIFLEHFFDVLKSPEQFNEQVVSNCRD